MIQTSLVLNGEFLHLKNSLLILLLIASLFIHFFRLCFLFFKSAYVPVNASLYRERMRASKRMLHTVCMLLDLKRTHSTLRLIDENFRLLAKLFKHANKLNFQFIKLTYSKAFRPLKDNFTMQNIFGVEFYINTIEKYKT